MKHVLTAALLLFSSVVFCQVSGTYIPTLSVTPKIQPNPVIWQSHYSSIGNEVFVDGHITVSVTVSSGLVQTHVSLPIPSNLLSGLPENSYGSGIVLQSTDITAVNCFLQGNTSANDVLLSWRPTQSGAQNLFYHFCYTIK